MSGPATYPPPRPRSGVGPWIGVGLTVVGLLVATSVLGRPASATATGASAWFPPDGHRNRLASERGVAAVEWSRPSPMSLSQTAPEAFGAWTQATSVPWDSTEYLRSREHLLDAGGGTVGSTDTVWVLGEDGARLALAVTPQDEILFEPGLLAVPSDLAVGRDWQSSGALAQRVPGEQWKVHSYEADLRASAPAEPALAEAGCVRIASDLRFADQTRTREETWCPAAGIVAARASDTDWVATGTGPAARAAQPQAFDWDRAGQLSFTEYRLNQVGLGASHVYPVSAPAGLPDGTVVFSNQLLPDVLALEPSGHPPPVSWGARPGAAPTAASSFGEVTVVATLSRALVAYGGEGQWLWEAALTDIAAVRPVRVEDVVVVATLDGQVTGFDLSTGGELWRIGVAAEIRTPLAVAGDRVLVGDQAGGLTCLDAAGKEVWAIGADPASAIAVSGGPDPVVVAARGDSPVITAFGLADGEPRWRIRHYDNAREIVSLGDRLLLRDTDNATAIEASDGSIAWSWSQENSRAAVAGGERALLLTDTRLVLLDADGHQLAQWPHSLGEVSQTAYLSAGETQVVAYGPLGMAIGRLP